MKPFIQKLANLCEIILLPGGLRLKIKHPRFHWRDYRMCLRLRSSGVNPACIFDVGANEGQFGIGALAAFPDASLRCYEPGKDAFSRLQATIGGQKNVSIVNAALGAEVGRSLLHVTTSDQSSSLLPLHENHRLAYPEIKEASQEEVEISTLEKEVSLVGLIEPALLKIDTQGFEMKVMAGAGRLLSRFRWILIETSTRPMYEGEALFEEATNWLKDRGFQFRGPMEIHFSPSGEACQFDALYERVGTDTESKLMS